MGDPARRPVATATTNPFLAPKSRPLVVGHRGVPTRHQENTIAGFRRAVELGIPAVELDARLTADGVAVCLHDDHLGRLTGMPDFCRDLTWKQLARLRIRRHISMGVDARGRRVRVDYDREEPIPRLADVLEAIAPHVAINVELKLDSDRWWQADVGAVVARALVKADAVHRVIVTSFDPRKLRAAARTCPELAVGFCFDDSMLDFARPVLDRLPLIAAELATLDRRPGHNARRVLGRVVDTGVVSRFLRTRVVGVEHTLVGADTVARMHRRGVAIGTHTLFPIGSTTGKPIASSAAEAAEVARLVRLGVDWIESDDPERVLALVTEITS